MKALFIGNSHTYFNDMPRIFKEACGCSDVTMLAHGGMGLDFHAKQEEVAFNIKYGNYSHIVLQHVAHPFGDEEVMLAAVKQLCYIISKTKAKPVLYMPWPEKNNPQGLKRMADAYIRVGQELSIPVAPVGLVWEKYKSENPEAELYHEDGEHASLIGSTLAAYTIAATVLQRPLKPRFETERPLAVVANRCCFI